MAHIRLTGLIPPMITPMDGNRNVDEAAVAGLVEYLIAGGVDGIFALGSSGEGPLLTRAERRRLISATVKAVAGRVPVLVGALEPSAPTAIEAAQDAEELGATALVLTTPYYVVNDQAMAVRFVEAIMADTTLPIMLYNIPSATGHRFEPATVAQLAKHPRVIGLKDSSGDLASVQETLRLTRSMANFTVLMGAERLCTAALQMGAHGLVSGLGNVAPALLKQLYVAATTGDIAEATRCQDQVEALWHLHSPGHWLSNLKTAVSELGFGSGLAVDPILPAAPEQCEKIRTLLGQAGLLPLSRA